MKLKTPLIVRMSIEINNLGKRIAHFQEYQLILRLVFLPYSYLKIKGRII